MLWNWIPDDVERAFRPLVRFTTILGAVALLLVVTCAGWTTWHDHASNDAALTDSLRQAEDQATAHFRHQLAAEDTAREIGVALAKREIEIMAQKEAYQDLARRGSRPTVTTLGDSGDTTTLAVRLTKPVTVLRWPDATQDTTSLKIGRHIEWQAALIGMAGEQLARWDSVGGLWRLERLSWRSALSQSDSGRHAMRSQLALQEQLYEKRLDAERCRWGIIDCPSRRQAFVSGAAIGGALAAFLFVR